MYVVSVAVEKRGSCPPAHPPDAHERNPAQFKFESTIHVVRASKFSGIPWSSCSTKALVRWPLCLFYVVDWPPFQEKSSWGGRHVAAEREANARATLKMGINSFISIRSTAASCFTRASVKKSDTVVFAPFTAAQTGVVRINGYGVRSLGRADTAFTLPRANDLANSCLFLRTPAKAYCSRVPNLNGDTTSR